MNFSKQIYSISFSLLLLFVMPCFSQEYIVFKRQKGFNKATLSGMIEMSQNHVETASADTVVDIYNYYFTSNSEMIPLLTLIEDERKDSLLTRIKADLVVSAVVVRKMGGVVLTKVLSKDEVKKLDTFSEQQVLETFYGYATKQMGSRSPGMRYNRMLQYKLIINDGEKYILIDQPVLLTCYLVGKAEWYFPNEYRAGFLNASPEFLKFYTLLDFKKVINESPDNVWKQFHDRVFAYKKDETNDFGFPLFYYWELLNGDAGYMIRSLYYKNYHLGLGTFSLLPKVGIVSCSLRSSISETVMPTDISNYKIQAINGVTPSEFKLLLKKFVYNRTIWGGH